MTQMIVERKDEKRKLTPAELHKKLSAEKEKDHELVTGIFRFHDDRGGILKFRFKKYKGDNYTEYELIDGQRYRLPKMVIKHLNTECAYKQYAHAKDQFGSSLPVQSAQASRQPSQSQFADGVKQAASNARMYVRVPRCEFTPLEFTDVNEEGLLPSNLTQVTYIK